MFGADLVMKWIHVSSACLLLGSLALLMGGMIPAINGGDSSPFTALVMRRAKTIVHASLGLLLLSGIYNFWRVLSYPTLAHNSAYQSVLGTNVILFIIIFGLAIVALKKGADGGMPRARPLIPWMVLLTLIVILLSTYLNLTRINLLVANASQSAAGSAAAPPAPGVGMSLGGR